jgi:hypothetical protein
VSRLAQPPSGEPRVTRLDAPGALAAARELCGRYGTALEVHPPAAEIPGSYWGESEAGLLDGTLHVRTDTPLHSLLHELCHWVCMDPVRRAGLDTDAGGDFDEENAVCYLQILLADEIAGFGRGQMLADMDAWGYTFRLGSARAWFVGDAEDARLWLEREGLTDAAGRPSFRLRTACL